LRIDKFNFRVNREIRAPQVRVIAHDGKQLGVVKLEEALSESMKAGLDLIEIAPNANPPVAKIMDMGKFKYETEKRLKKEKRKTKAYELKEIRFSPFIAEHDFTVRMGKIKEFLNGGNKVRLAVVFKGKQMDSKNFGYEILKKVVAEFGESVAIDMKPKFVGRHLQMVISPVKKARGQEINEQNK